MIDRLRAIGARPLDVIVLDPKHGRDRHLSVTPRLLVGGSVSLMVLALVVGWSLRAVSDDFVDADLAADWRAAIDRQQVEIGALRSEAEATLGALTRRFGGLQARLLRMEALGERVAGAADVDVSDFLLEQEPAIGGPAPELDDSLPMEPPAFVSLIDDLSQQVMAREQQLLALETLMGVRRFEEAVTVAGRPVGRGWQSSAFGRRVDPINGRLAWHQGIDFAGAVGDPVTAVAAGVVVSSGERSGYGNLVEINHGNGYVTRYGHNDEILVQVGDVVGKGDLISRMGSSGRSTGPHVHFEVLKDGKRVDPARYIARGGD
ncbi:MAG TPA: M23 family metallopeptidase [Pseudomonadales bacterium]|nr:M23 family metallopeptidase [Pseudomonadales bacterium]